MVGAAMTSLLLLEVFPNSFGHVEIGEENLPLTTIPFMIGFPFRNSLGQVHNSFWLKDFRSAQTLTEDYVKRSPTFRFDTLARKSWILSVSKNYASALKVCNLSLLTLEKQMSELIESKEFSVSDYRYLRIKILTEARQFVLASKLLNVSPREALHNKVQLESYYFLKSAERNLPNSTFKGELKKLGYTNTVYNGLRNVPVIHDQPFSKVKWDKGLLMERGAFNSRLHCLGDLLKKYNLLQLSRTKILELLGPPVFWSNAPVNTDTFAIGFYGTLEAVYSRTPIWLMCVHYDLDSKPAFIQIIQSPITCVPDALFKQ